VRDPDLKIEPGTELQLLDEQVFSIQMSQETIDLLQRRENEMKEVAQSVHDLNDLMTSYSFLVAQQGECLDSIEQRLEEAKVL
jgi:t-SNARE complex subunit (syntaxin)